MTGSGITFGRLLRRIRMREGFTMGQLARALDMDVADLSAMETDDALPWSREQTQQALTVMSTDDAWLRALSIADGEKHSDVNVDEAEVALIEACAGYDKAMATVAERDATIERLTEELDEAREQLAEADAVVARLAGDAVGYGDDEADKCILRHRERQEADHD